MKSLSEPKVWTFADGADKAGMLEMYRTYVQKAIQSAVIPVAESSSPRV
jgi:hypothetical protein